jgi:hypothetical protein
MVAPPTAQYKVLIFVSILPVVAHPACPTAQLALMLQSASRALQTILIPQGLAQLTVLPSVIVPLVITPPISIA